MRRGQAAGRSRSLAGELLHERVDVLLGGVAALQELDLGLVDVRYSVFGAW
jgi:hypothetical protein